MNLDQIPMAMWGEISPIIEVEKIAQFIDDDIVEIVGGLGTFQQTTIALQMQILRKINANGD